VPDVLGQKKGTPAVIGEPAPNGTGQLDAVSCADAAHCWAVGTTAPGAVTGSSASSPPPQATVIDATIDGGKTWVVQPLELTATPSLSSISCPSLRLCMAVGLSGTGDAGIVLTTRSAGADWLQAATPAGAVVITSVDCADPGDCTAIASDGTSFWSAQSANFGQSWQREGNLPPGLQDAGNLSCASDATCLVTGFLATTAGHGQGAIVFSADGGGTWAASSVPTGTGLVQSAVCASIDSCLAVGTTSTTVSAVVPARGALLQSDDDGRTWVDSPTTPPVDDIYGVACPSATTCVIVGTHWIGTPTVGTGAVGHSDDGGASFIASRTEYAPLALTAVSCPTTRRCVAVGGDTVARVSLPGSEPTHATGNATTTNTKSTTAIPRGR
jgi:hypothetical protein